MELGTAPDGPQCPFPFHHCVRGGEDIPCSNTNLGVSITLGGIVVAYCLFFVRILLVKKSFFPSKKVFLG